MRLRWALALWLGALVAVPVGATSDDGAPSIVFVLLDTTRADRFGAWGNPHGPTPALDALARRGVRFARHYANAHATRPSMPQLMSGRYYHDNILAPFQANAHPREMSFARPDPSASLLPRLLRAAGYATVGVSAHTWVAPESEFGRDFDHLELLPFAAKAGHADAAPLVDRAIALWGARDRSRPLLLYLHLMDMHMPRRLPEGEPRYPVAGYDWRRRFRPDGETEFGRRRRAWDRHDATDFTAADRAHYAAVYDTRLAYADGQLARLFATLETSDPGLRHTLVVVTADHGEELAEDDRIEHSASLADGVQHVPWIMAGAALEPGQQCEAVTEHVDVVPTVLEALGLPLPGDVRVDGTSRIEGGRLRAPCGGRSAFYAWEDYRAVRRGHYLFTEYPDATPRARCEGREHLYRLDGFRRHPIDGPAVARRTQGLRRLLQERLDEIERAYVGRRYDRPAASFLLRTDYWRIDPAPPLRCVAVDEATPPSALLATGWTWTGRGIAPADPRDALPVRVAVPPGEYRVEAATSPIAPAPWLFGRRRWKRRAFQGEVPSTFVALGTVAAPEGELGIALPTTLSHHHVLALRLTPPGAPETAPAVLDREQHERLRALGYVQ